MEWNRMQYNENSLIAARDTRCVGALKLLDHEHTTSQLASSLALLYTNRKSGIIRDERQILTLDNATSFLFVSFRRYCVRAKTTTTKSNTTVSPV